MNQIFILCDGNEREELINAFTECNITSMRDSIKSDSITLVALKIEHNSINEIIACALKFARENNKVLIARRDDYNGHSNPIEVTEKNIFQVLAENKTNMHCFLFDDKLPEDEISEEHN